MTDTTTAESPRAAAGKPKPGKTAAQIAKSAGSAAPKKPAKAAGESKIGQVVALLQRPEGATLAEMIAATGWLPHTTRAALTGLKKKGHVITRDKRGDATCYRAAKAA